MALTRFFKGAVEWTIISIKKVDENPPLTDVCVSTRFFKYPKKMLKRKNPKHF